MIDTIFLIKESDNHKVAKLLEENEIPFRVDEVINTDYLGTPQFASKMNKKAQLNKIVIPEKPLKKVVSKAEITAILKIKERNRGGKPAKDLGSYNKRLKFAKKIGYKDISDAIIGIGSGRAFAQRFKDEFVA
tara:strand:+ start:304 stop:702 length:399 start_codon:yes stop_codon:yes gene_type:complete